MRNTAFPGFRKMQHSSLAQVRNHARWYLAVFAVLALLLTVVFYLHYNTHIIVTELFEDPVEFGVLPLHVGMYSYLGGTAFIVAGSLLLFAALSALHVAHNMRTYVLIIGLLLLWFGLDDIFLIHEWVGLRLAWLIQSENVPQDRQWLEVYVFLAYALAWGAIIVYFRAQVLRTAWILLALSLASLGVSVVLDMSSYLPLVPSPASGMQTRAMFIAEDMAKLAGGFFLLAYAIHSARDAVRHAYAAVTETPSGE